MKNRITYTGVLDFFPDNVSKKHLEQSEWKKTALIKGEDDIEKYYRNFLVKRFGFNGGMPTLRGTHVTFINDRVNDKLSERYEEIAYKYNNTEIDFTIKLDELRSNGLHWWFNVLSDQALDIREEIGLNRYPYFGLHFTICRFNQDNILTLEESFRALDNCLFFNI